MSGAAGTLHRFDSFFAPSNGDSFYTSNPGGESLGAYSQTGTNVWHLFMGQSSTGINNQSVALIWRFYSGSIGDHLFKRGSNTPGGYTREGPVGVAFTGSGPYRQAVYRYYNSSTGDHRYDTSSSTPSGYVREGIAWYSPILVYGCSDPNANNYNSYVNQSSSGCNYTVYGCMDPLASNYNPNANANSGCSYPTPSISFSISPPAIIRGQNSTLSWSISNATSRSLSSVGAIAASGSTVVSPADDRTYTISAGYYGYTSNSSTKTLLVYIPPVVTLSLDDSTITLGQSTVLRWSTTGDATTNNIQPGIGASNLTSFQVVSPTVTTTYTATASGLGGTDSDQITLTVLQPPDVDLTVPLNVTYGNSLELGYTSINATVSLKIVPYYYSLDGVETIGPDVVLPTGDNVSGTITHTPVWDNRGPMRIEYKLRAEGVGSLTDEDVEIVPAIIDQLPDAITVPESNDLIKDQAPVISPDVELTTDQLLVTDIDIPVEIKSNYPIQVEIDNDGIWIDVENL